MKYLNVLLLCKCRKKISLCWCLRLDQNIPHLNMLDYLFCWGMLKISLKNYSFYFVLRNFTLETGLLGFSYEAIVKCKVTWSCMVYTFKIEGYTVFCYNSIFVKKSCLGWFSYMAPLSIKCSSHNNRSRSLKTNYDWYLTVMIS